MGGLGLLVRLDAGLDVLRRRRLVGIYLGADRGGVILGEQALKRVLHESGVAQIAVAVHEGVAHRLGHEMDRLGRAEAERPHVVALEDVEDLAHRDPARARRRCRQQDVAAIAAAERRSLGRRVMGEVPGGENAAIRLARLGDRARDRALVEGIGPALGNELERRRELLLDETVARLEGRAVGLEENPARDRVLAEALDLVVQDVGVGAAQDVALARELDGGRHDLGARQPAVLAARALEPHHRARHAGREIAVEAQARDRLAGRIEVHRLARGRGSGLAEIDEAVAAVREMEDHEAAAADVAAAGIDDRERVADRDRRVDGVAALLEDAHADLGGVVLGADHHAVLRLDGKRRGGVGLRREAQCQRQRGCRQTICRFQHAGPFSRARANLLTLPSPPEGGEGFCRECESAPLLLEEERRDLRPSGRGKVRRPTHQASDRVVKGSDGLCASTAGSRPSSTAWQATSVAARAAEHRAARAGSARWRAGSADGRCSPAAGRAGSALRRPPACAARPAHLEVGNRRRAACACRDARARGTASRPSRELDEAAEIHHADPVGDM